MFYSDYIEGNEFIKFNNGNIVLPQIVDIMRIFEVKGKYAYVDGGVENARKQYGDYWVIFLTEPVLPIISNPTNEDSDNDGLFDGKAQDYKGKIIAPQDSNPLVTDGPVGMWKTHIENVTKNDIPSELGDWYGYSQQSDLSMFPELNKVINDLSEYADWGTEYINLLSDNSGVEGFAAFMDEWTYLCLESDIIDISSDDYKNVAALVPLIENLKPPAMLGRIE